jgi:hypothetical protein
METGILKEVIAVIRAEQQRRASLLTDEDPNFAYDHWLFKDEPFVNELCLMLLVTLRHHVERELVRLARGRLTKGRKSAVNNISRVRSLGSDLIIEFQKKRGSA